MISNTKFEIRRTKTLNDFDIPTLTESDFNKMVKNPFISKFTLEEKFRAYLEAYIIDNGWSKEHVREEVDAVLS